MFSPGRKQKPGGYFRKGKPQLGRCRIAVRAVDLVSFWWRLDFLGATWRADLLVRLFASPPEGNARSGHTMPTPGEQHEFFDRSSKHHPYPESWPQNFAPVVAAMTRHPRHGFNTQCPAIHIPLAIITLNILQERVA
jgi:hypothetical protein